VTVVDTAASTYLPHGAHQPRGNQPWCAPCDTDRHLLVDSITVMDPRRETLAAAFNCTRCGSSRVLSTTVVLIAVILARSPAADDVMQLGAEYIHCGEPLHPGDPEATAARKPISTGPMAADFLGAYLRTRVLQCRCGFQVEIPH
jgi:hypothetical protein